MIAAILLVHDGEAEHGLGDQRPGNQQPQDLLLKSAKARKPRRQRFVMLADTEHVLQLDDQFVALGDNAVQPANLAGEVVGGEGHISTLAAQIMASKPPAIMPSPNMQKPNCCLSVTAWPPELSSCDIPAPWPPCRRACRRSTWADRDRA